MIAGMVYAISDNCRKAVKTQDIYIYCVLYVYFITGPKWLTPRVADIFYKEFQRCILLFVFLCLFLLFMFMYICLSFIFIHAYKC